MYPTPTTDFNRYRNNNRTVDMHFKQRCNPLADLSLPNNCTIVNPTLVQKKSAQPSLTNSINQEILTNLKTKEKEFVEEVNYYQNLNRHGIPQEANLQMTESMGRNRSRFMRGESYAQEGELGGQSLGMTKPGQNPMVRKKKEDFLDRFITRQNNWQGYYKNVDKLETLKCDKYPNFLTNSEFIPNDKENGADFDSDAFSGMKKSKLLPNSVVIDRNVRERQVNQNWSKNYSGVLNNQKVLKDVNYMELNQYNALSKKISRPYVHTDASNPRIDPVLKETIMDLYNQI